MDVGGHIFPTLNVSSADSEFSENIKNPENIRERTSIQQKFSSLSTDTAELIDYFENNNNNNNFLSDAPPKQDKPHYDRGAPHNLPGSPRANYPVPIGFRDGLDDTVLTSLEDTILTLENSPSNAHTKGRSYYPVPDGFGGVQAPHNRYAKHGIEEVKPAENLGLCELMFCCNDPNRARGQLSGEIIVHGNRDPRPMF